MKGRPGLGLYILNQNMAKAKKHENKRSGTQTNPLKEDPELKALLKKVEKVHTKHGDTMEFLTFEDEGGIVEATFFPAVYERFCHMVDRNRPYLLYGKVEEDWGAVTLTVDKVKAL